MARTTEQSEGCGKDSVAVSEAGATFAWGRNEDGELGIGHAWPWRARARLEAATEATEVANAEAAADKSAANAREAALEQELESLRQLMPVCPSAGLIADGSGPGVGDGDEIEEMRTKLEMAEAETEELRQALAMRKDELKKSKEDIALIQMVRLLRTFCCAHLCSGASLGRRALACPAPAPPQHTLTFAHGHVCVCMFAGAHGKRRSCGRTGK